MEWYAGGSAKIREKQLYIMYLINFQTNFTLISRKCDLQSDFVQKANVQVVVACGGGVGCRYVFITI